MKKLYLKVILLLERQRTKGEREKKRKKGDITFKLFFMKFRINYFNYKIFFIFNLNIKESLL